MCPKTTATRRFVFRSNLWSTCRLQTSTHIRTAVVAPGQLENCPILPCCGRKDCEKLEKRSNVCWSAVLVWGCFSDSRSLYTAKTPLYWEVNTNLLIVFWKLLLCYSSIWGPKKKCRGKWRCPVILQRKGTLFTSSRLLLARTYNASLHSFQPLHIFLPGSSLGKVWISDVVWTSFIFILNLCSPQWLHIICGTTIKYKIKVSFNIIFLLISNFFEFSDTYEQCYIISDLQA